MDFQLSVVFDKAQFAEFVHEEAHPRSGRADHLRQGFLTKLSHDRLRPASVGAVSGPGHRMRTATSKRSPGECSRRARTLPHPGRVAQPTRTSTAASSGQKEAVSFP